jgi:hypothetical protein
MSKQKLGSGLAERLKAAKAELESIPKKSIEETTGLPLKQKNKTDKEDKRAHREKAKDSEPSSKISTRRRRNSTVEPKLHVTGRFDKSLLSHVNKALYLPEKMNEEIKSYCKGSDISVYNYLMYLGLQKVKSSHEILYGDVEKIENCYLEEDS